MNTPDRHRLTGLVVALALAAAVGALTSVLALRSILQQDVRDSAQARTVLAMARLRSATEKLTATARGFLLTGDPKALARWDEHRRRVVTMLDQLDRTYGARTGAMIGDVRVALGKYADAADAVLQLRNTDAASAFGDRYDRQVSPRRAALDAAMDRLVEAEEDQLETVEKAGEARSSTIAAITSGVAVGAMAVAATLAWLLVRALGALDRKQRQLQMAKSRLETVNGDLEAFAGRVAHDLRSPLAPITLVAGTLQNSSPDPAVQRAATRILASTQRANDLVEGLLAFSRAGRSDGEAAAADTVVRQCLEDMAPRMAAAAVTLQTELASGAQVACGATLLREVVDNLVGNAVKHLAGEPERRLGVRVRQTGSAVCLQVEDSGPGIPADAAARIFEPFYRVPGCNVAGSGIGLATVRRIVEAHGGEVAVSSVVGQGSVFRVHLPAAGPHRAPQERPAPVTDPLSTEPISNTQPG